MDIKKSSLLEDRFELSSFSLKIYNVNAGGVTGISRLLPFINYNPTGGPDVICVTE